MTYVKKSPLLDVKVKYENEVFRFNLYEELMINENSINKELQEQPSYYGFMGLLLVRLQRSFADAEAEFFKKEAELYIKFKSEINTNTHRENSNELTKALVIDNQEYQTALTRVNKLKENVGIIKHCLSSFEQRSNLIQSLSANMRKETI